MARLKSPNLMPIVSGVVVGAVDEGLEAWHRQRVKAEPTTNTEPFRNVVDLGRAGMVALGLLAQMSGTKVPFGFADAMVQGGTTLLTKSAANMFVNQNGAAASRRIQASRNGHRMVPQARVPARAMNPGSTVSTRTASGGNILVAKI